MAHSNPYVGVSMRRWVGLRVYQNCTNGYSAADYLPSYWWQYRPIKNFPNPEYLLFRSSGDLKGFIPFPSRSKANSSSFPKTHFSQSGHFSSSAGYSNFPVLHNRKELKFFVNNSTHAMRMWHKSRDRYKIQKSIFSGKKSLRITFQL